MFYEKKWNILLSGNEDIALLEEIDSWIGTPYKYGGATKEGTDCSGLIITIYKKIYNIDLTRSSYELWRESVAVKRKELKSGDFVFFRMKGDKISHAGIYISNGYFVHASSSRGVVIDSLDNEYYSLRFANGGRIKKH